MALSREEIAERYGSAILDYAKDENVLDSFHEELQILKEAVKENPRFIDILSSPVVRIDEKKELLSEVEKDFISEIQNFLNLLLEYGRFANLVDIIDKFNELYNQEKSIAVGTVTTAVKINDDQLNRLGETYAKKYNLEEVHLENKVDPSILGGVILQVKDLVIDGSVKNKLNKIRNQLSKE